jgi:predicted aspartyl protease
MSVPFDLELPTVRVRGYVAGSRLGDYVTFAVDTGATRTMLRSSVLRYIGCDFSRPVGRAQLTAATGLASAPIVSVKQITSLGRTWADFGIVAHDLPDSFEGDGLLGLDFFRGLVLTIDFANGLVGLTEPVPPRRWWQFLR